MFQRETKQNGIPHAPNWLIIAFLESATKMLKILSQQWKDLKIFSHRTRSTLDKSFVRF